MIDSNSSDNSLAPSNSTKRVLWIFLGSCTAILACTICVIIAAAAAIIFVSQSPAQLYNPEDVPATAVESAPTTSEASDNYPRDDAGNQASDFSTPDSQAVTASTPLPPQRFELVPPEGIVQRAISPQAFANLRALFDSNYPYQDYFETAARLGGKDLGPRTVSTTQYRLNDRKTFQVDDGRITAELMAITDHVYFWVEEGLDFNRTTLDEVARRFEETYYPSITSLFGQEWRPGVDNDPHFSILHLRGSATAAELGYFTNVDEYPNTLYPESNQQELVYLNMAQLELDSDLYYGTLSHELQHLIQWYVDPNEATWLNEGLSQLAEIYMGLNTVDAYDFELKPSTRLNSWDNDEETIDMHYAAAFLYSVYIWEQLGERAVQELSRHPANGLASLSTILAGHQPDLTLEEFTADWVAANYLDDPAAGPRYYYRNLNPGSMSVERRIRELPLDATAELDQFGTHYLDLDFRGPITISFAGDTLVPIVDNPPRNGNTMWLAPGEDDSNARLTAEFDLSATNKATLQFSTWYDLEDEYDFAYVSISVDNGVSWELLVPDHLSAGEFGPAFNGQSAAEPDAADGWLKESISLDRYTGQPVLVQFDVLTDYETDDRGSGQGFAIDDIAIPEISYFTDLESNTGSPPWQAAGFVQIGWELPQQWSVQLIEGGPNPRVTKFALDPQNRGQWQIDIGKGGGVLAITPLTPFVDARASYWLRIDS